MALAANSPTSPNTQPLVTHELRYHQPEAGEAILVWGINKWSKLPESQWPPGTKIQDGVMQTPMVRSQNYFSVKLQVPANSTIDSIFHVPQTANGEPVKIWDNNRKQGYHTNVGQGGVTDIYSTLFQTPAYTLFSDFLFLLLLLGVSVIFAVPALVHRLAQKINLPNFSHFKPKQLSERQVILLFLIALTLLGFALRFWVAWKTNRVLPDTRERLIGDEPGYEGLAYWLLKGAFFQWPGRTPLYPTFISLCYLIFGISPAKLLYAQALVGTSLVPLTFLLTQRFTTPAFSLLAAALVAIHPSLILHVTRVYPEILYTPLLIVTLLALLNALEKPMFKRFGVAGALLAITNLCRPTMMLFPAAIPLLMPLGWTLKRKISLFLAYILAVVVVTAPWTYHNFRTYNVFLPYSVSTGVLWLGSPEYYHLVQDKRNLLRIWDEYMQPKRNGGHDPFSIEGDRYFKKRAIASIKAEPGVYIWYSLQKLAFFWFGNIVDWGHHAMHSVDTLRAIYTKQRLIGIFSTRLMPLVALAGLMVSRHRWRQFWPLLAVCGYFTAIHAITYAQIRFSEPLYPILATFIAVAVGDCWHRLKLLPQSISPNSAPSNL